MHLHHKVLRTNRGLANFRGNAIELVDTDTYIDRDDICDYSISYLGKIRLLLKSDQSVLEVNFTPDIIIWLDKLYFAKLFFIALTFIISTLYMFIKLGTSYIVFIILFATLNASLLSLFFRYVSLSPHKGWRYVVLMSIGLNLPLALFLPTSKILWGAYVILFVIYGLVYSMQLFNKKIAYSIFLGIAWFLLVVTCFHWFIVSLKFYSDIAYYRQFNTISIELCKISSCKKKIPNMFHLANKVAKKSSSWVKNDLIYNKHFLWVAPSTWQVNWHFIWQKWLYAKKIIFQIQPLKPAVVVHVSEQQFMATMGIYSLTWPGFMQILTKYLQYQKNFLMTKELLRVPVKKIKLTHLKSEAYIHQIAYFNFNTQNETVISFVGIPLSPNEMILWSLEQQDVNYLSDSSVGYTLKNISQGLFLPR